MLNRALPPPSWDPSRHLPGPVLRRIIDCGEAACVGIPSEAKPTVIYFLLITPVDVGFLSACGWTQCGISGDERVDLGSSVAMDTRFNFSIIAEVVK